MVHNELWINEHYGLRINLSRIKGFFKKMEDLGFPCVNSYDSVIICEDKLQTTRKLQLAKIPVPKTALI